MKFESFFRRFLSFNIFSSSIVIILFMQPLYASEKKVVPINPIANRTRAHLDHGAYFKDPVKSPQEMTKKCLSCHKEAAKEVMKTPHWSWLSGDVERQGKTVRIGKSNLMNNYCISVSGNWASCTKCHAGYGWTDKNFDFTKSENVDCLVCHDGSGTYTKGKGGLPTPTVDLAAVGSRWQKRQSSLS